MGRAPPGPSNHGRGRRQPPLRGLLRVNDRLGLKGGERMLGVVMDGLRALCPDRPLVRLHGDAFAALYLPPGGHELGEGASQRFAAELIARADREMPELREHGLEPGFTVACVDLAIERPSHWRVLGPLVFAEGERALVAVRTGASFGLERRRIDLDAYVG